jgi:plastocyanin
MRPALIPATLLALGAAAAPAQAADVTISGFAFNPTPITIAQGDTVTWHWAGPDTNHSVTADPMQADSWDSDPLKPPTAADHPPGDTFDHKFDTPGTFTYFCKVHSSMHGKVIVNAPGGNPPPPGDTTAPAITGLSARGGRTCPKRKKHCAPRPTVLHFSLSEDAQVKLEVAKHPAANLTRAGRAGANTIKLSTRKLPPGKYKVKLTATDGAGNASAPANATVHVRRG